MQFVLSSASDESREFEFLLDSLVRLNAEEHKVPELMTAAIGLASEGGEFAEVIKKVIFQGKPLDNDTYYHLQRELGDVAWYFVLGCYAARSNPQKILEMNIEKLMARYPEGFDAFKSENRADNDV